MRMTRKAVCALYRLLSAAVLCGLRVIRRTRTGQSEELPWYTVPLISRPA